MTKFLGLLSLIFVVAKLANWIDWSWWLVFSPIIAAAVLALLIIAGSTWFLVKYQGT